jgi:hypothetical protein
MIFLLPAGFLPLASQVKTVWALGDGDKVFRDDLNHPYKKRNLTWDGKSIHLKGLYNEVLAFQVIVEAGGLSAESIEVSIVNPINRSAGSVIGGNTLKYGPAGTIEIFSQHYLHVEEDRYTRPGWFYGSPASAPANMTGWIPDALIPAHARSGPVSAAAGPDSRPARDDWRELGGFPVNIGPSRNQGFWIDLHLPRDRVSHPAGLYQGSVQIFENGSLKEEIPLEVTLLPAYLPDENRKSIWLYTSAVYSYFPELPRIQVDRLLKYEGRRHRIDVTGGFSANRTRFNEETMNDYKAWLDGSAYTPANGYRGPGQGTGERYFPVGIYGASVMGDTREDVQEQSDLWVNWFTSNAPDINYFWYIIDEPPESRFPWIRERAGWVKSNPGPGKGLPVFTTRRYQEELVGAIDVWSAYNGVELENLPAARKDGGDYFFYNGLRPHNGTTILEGAAVDFRINSWILYKYDINCHFIWEGTHWRHNWQGPKGRLHQNVFRSPLTFTEFGEHSYGNGAGVLFYPGRMPFYPDEDRGLNSLLPSVRLKNIRRGQQDAAIMWMAEQKAGREKVLEIISEVVPLAVSEVEKGAAVPWSEKGDDYDRVRNALLEIVVR